MFKFFRSLRLLLLSEGKIRSYLKYALGELILVVLGIVIALQLNNWNEKRKLEAEYIAVLEQIYTVIDQDSKRLTLIRDQLIEQYDFIDIILEEAEQVDKRLLPHLMFYVFSKPPNLLSETTYMLRHLKFNPQNERQSNLNKNLSSYANNINREYKSTNNSSILLLEQKLLPHPPIVFGYSASNNFEDMNLNYFSENEIYKAIELLGTPDFKNALRSEKSTIQEHLIFTNNSIDLAHTNKTLIKEYYPEVKLLYSTIGIVGSATVYNDWVTNVPLRMTDESKSIWEGTLELGEGTVKFREGTNWNFNWGGNSFPKGNSQSYGNNIIVKPGNYHIILNLSEKSYQFIEVND